MKLVLALTLCLSISGLALALDLAPVVQTKQGKVVGVVREFEDEKVHIYQGLRYGKLYTFLNSSLIFSLTFLGTAERFSRSKMVTPWTGTYNATTFQFACPQGGYHLSTKVDLSRGFETGSSNEDCLFLNVFKPATESAKPRPVMVWIHGGKSRKS